MATVEITIDDLGVQGDGVAHYKGSTVFVTGALKGEQVRIELEDNTNAVKRGQLLEILIPNSQRVKPECPHFPQCGGCRLQHINDSAYAEFKVKELQDILVRGKLKFPPFMPVIITACETRRRARVAVQYEPTGIVIGFNEWRSQEIVDMHACPVMKPIIVNLVDRLRSYLPVWLRQGQKCDIQISALADGLDVVLIGGRDKLDVDDRQSLAELAERLDVSHLSWRKWDRSPVEPIAHRRPLGVHLGNTSVPFPPGSFLQATEAGEESLVNFVCREDKPNVRALDLFCGLGTFGLSLEKVKHVHFCDLDGPAIEALKRTTRGIANYEVSLRNLNVNAFTTEECNEYDLVIFDPPRGGAKAQAEHLAQSNVPCVMAISCDTTSFARDAKILTDGGYVLEKVLPVDQFLWSTHLELAAKFVKN